MTFLKCSGKSPQNCSQIAFPATFILEHVAGQAGLALSRASRAPSLLARAEPNLTSARSAHERLCMESRAPSEPPQWPGSLGNLHFLRLNLKRFDLFVTKL